MYDIYENLIVILVKMLLKFIIKLYKWLNDYNIEKQRNKTVKYELVKDDVYYRGGYNDKSINSFEKIFCFTRI